MQDNKTDSHEIIDDNTKDSELRKDSQRNANEMNAEMMENLYFEQEVDAFNESLKKSGENKSERASSRHSNGKSKKRK